MAALKPVNVKIERPFASNHLLKTLINAPVSGKRHQTTKAVSRTGTALFGKDESRMFSPDSVSIRLAL
ncbi:hypothetical protein RO3G_14893 [Rhizopus delemar RA 99-880]|uniref:Uncharacterized protein n=1 Tax=Rhizopus delemar (strain RA 99-880 / ATCC MYA-4621 / FGSC 9543 / NRRL 43880) TaxID=246409 RepID=I1CP02_RHIO9|nr:hypothetical protein RO3G_14893 [Rhizopus delemar RA 99-880]|eukprot:EIE90182.1 hypothetical protein RO3G_14893 [Rhizopus delemar RA 99-880]